MMTKNGLTIFLFFCFFQFAHAQESDTLTPWKFGGKASLSISQISLQHWSAGGDESVSGLGMFTVTAKYKRDSTLMWENILDINYGLQKINDRATQKTDDLFDFSSKFGRRATGNLYYSALLSFQTQMQEGFQEGDTTGLPSSRFLTPAYVVASVGMDFNLDDNFTLLLSPVTSKTTIVNDERLSDMGAFGVDPGKTFRYEIGGYLKTRYTLTLFKNVEALMKLNLFTNYIEKPENIDVDSEVNITMQINNFLAATIRTNLKYDHDIAFTNNEGEQVNSYLQFKEVLGITLTYKFL
jgi:hypothetical protein